MKPLRSQLWAKVTAFLLLFVLGVIWTASALGVLVLAKNDAYFDAGTSLHTDMLDNGAQYYRSYLYPHLEALAYPDIFYIDRTEFNDLFSGQNCNFFFTVTDENGQVVLSNFTDTSPLRTYHYEYEFPATYQNEWDTDTADNTDMIRYTVEAGIAGNLTAKDRIYYYTFYTDLLISARYVLAVLVGLLPLAMITLVIFLCCAAGHHAEAPYIRPNAIDRIPLELLLGMMAAVLFGCMWFCNDLIAPDAEWIGLIVAAIPLSLMLLLTVATRIKCGTLFKNTLIRRIIALVCHIVRGIGRMLIKIPLYWKTALIWTVYSFAQLFVFLLFGDAEYLVFWIPEKLLLTPLIIWVVIQLQTLRHAAKELASGHIDHTVNTHAMFPVFKEHAENLNNIGNGMHIAMEESLKSERMRLELISNVSHDIKTPLTSIINYVDLLKKEGLQSEHAPSYLDVLERQSWRLKKLTEDVVEASKVSTGHIRVNRTPLDSTILLQQALAEYADRLEERSLETVVRLGKQPLPILADGRLLWRVFDNALSNIIKYAKSDTRVYILVEEQNGQVHITFKNISSAPLDISPDELTERFVRGDRSRHTDGSGLGLSIAKSLTELQDGTFSIDIDGDLFKVALSFPVITP